MADITSTLSEFDEWLKKRRQSQVAMSGTVESGDYGAKPFYTAETGLGESGPSMNEEEYARLGRLANPANTKAETPPPIITVPKPGTAAREEGIESIRLAAQGVPKVSALETATNHMAPEEFSRPDVWSGQRFVPGAGAKNEEEYNKRWEMASALESAGKPYWEKTKEGYKPVFQPESVLKGKLETFGGETEATVDNLRSQASYYRSHGESALADAVEKRAEAKLKGVTAELAPGLATAEIGLRGEQAVEAGASAEWKRAEAKKSAAEEAWIKAGKPTTGAVAEEYQKGVLGILQKFGPPEEDTRRSIFGVTIGSKPPGLTSKGALDYWNTMYGVNGMNMASPDKKKKSLWEQYK